MRLTQFGSCLFAFGLLGAAVDATAADGDAVAMVNGTPISKWELQQVLKDAHGLQVMQQLIVLELARQESKRLGLKVSEGEVDREFERAMKKIAGETREDGKKLTESEQRQALEFMLQQKCISMPEFRIGMCRNAHLRKIVEQRFEVTEATLREEFARTHGERVEVRHIQVDDTRSLSEALNLLSEGIDFAEVARRVSKNAATGARGGLLEPFSFNASPEEVASQIREQAFAMKPGDVSPPVRVGRWWHILKLERRIPPENVDFESVRPDVERSLRERVIPEMMNELLMRLYERANIRVLDSDLRGKYREMMEKNQLPPSAQP